MSASRRGIDGGWGWLVVVGAHLSRAFSVAVFMVSGPFIVEWLEYFGKSAAVTSGIFSLTLFMSAIVCKYDHITFY